MNPRHTETRRELDPRLGWIEWSFTTCPLPPPSQLSPYGPDSRAETDPRTIPHAQEEHAQEEHAPAPAPQLDRRAYVLAVTRTAPGTRLASARLAMRLAALAPAFAAPAPSRRSRRALAALRAALRPWNDALANAYEPSIFARVAHYHADTARRGNRPFRDRWQPVPVDLHAEAAAQLAALRAAPLTTR